MAEDRIPTIGVVCSLSLSSRHALLLLLRPHSPCFPQPTCFWLLLETRPPGLASCCCSGPRASASFSALDSALAHIAFATCPPVCWLAHRPRETSLMVLGVSAGGQNLPGAAAPLGRGVLILLCFPASTQQIQRTHVPPFNKGFLWHILVTEIFGSFWQNKWLKKSEAVPSPPSVTSRMGYRHACMHAQIEHG